MNRDQELLKANSHIQILWVSPIEDHGEPNFKVNFEDTDYLCRIWGYQDLDSYNLQVWKEDGKKCLGARIVGVSVDKTTREMAENEVIKLIKQNRYEVKM